MRRTAALAPLAAATLLALTALTTPAAAHTGATLPTGVITIDGIEYPLDPNSRECIEIRLPSNSSFPLHQFTNTGVFYTAVLYQKADCSDDLSFRSAPPLTTVYATARSFRAVYAD